MTSSPSVVEQVPHVRRCFSGGVEEATWKLLVECASVLEASEMLAAGIECVRVQVEELLVNLSEGNALAVAKGAACRHVQRWLW